MVIGKDAKTAVATLVERISRLLILVPLTGRDSLPVGNAVIAATGGLPAQIRRSLTWDCGSEMARHADIIATGLPVYFAHPHSPWERGSNENLNRIDRIGSCRPTGHATDLSWDHGTVRGSADTPGAADTVPRTDLRFDTRTQPTENNYAAQPTFDRRPGGQNHLLTPLQSAG